MNKLVIIQKCDCGREYIFTVLVSFKGLHSIIVYVHYVWNCLVLYVDSLYTWATMWILWIFIFCKHIFVFFHKNGEKMLRMLTGNGATVVASMIAIFNYWQILIKKKKCFYLKIMRVKDNLYILCVTLIFYLIMWKKGDSQGTV